MAYPTGTGSEILGRIGGTYNTASTTTIVTVPALHIYTILSASFCRNGSSSAEIKLTGYNGSSDFQIVESTLSSSTFVWNDKLVLMGGDLLKLTLNNTEYIKYWVSYIDQNWEN